MKSLNLLTGLGIALFFAACSNSETKSADQTTAAADTTTITPPIVGNDVDEHGCKPSTGYTWSVVKNDCIAVFTVGIRLAPIDSFMDKTTSAFVVFKSDTEQDKAELFIPKQKGTLIADKVADKPEDTWKHAEYVLTRSKDVYTLKDNDNRVLYAGTPGK